MTTSLITAVYHNDGGLIRQIMTEYYRTISDQQIIAAENLCRYLHREHLLQFFVRPTPIAPVTEVTMPAHLENKSIFRFTKEERKLYLDPMIAQWDKEDEEAEAEMRKFDAEVEELIRAAEEIQKRKLEELRALETDTDREKREAEELLREIRDEYASGTWGCPSYPRMY